MYHLGECWCQMFVIIIHQLFHICGSTSKTTFSRFCQEIGRSLWLWWELDNNFLKVASQRILYRLGQLCIHLKFAGIFWAQFLCLAWWETKTIGKSVDLNTNVSLLIVSKETSRSLTYYYEEASQIYIDTSSPPLSTLMGLSYSVDTLHPSPFGNCGLILSVEESSINTDLDDMS